MFYRFLLASILAVMPAMALRSQPPPEIQKMMDEINSRPRYFWCSVEQAQYVLHLVVHVDNRLVGEFSIPFAKAKREEIPNDDPQKIVDYHFHLQKHGHRKFRGISSGQVEGNFWVGLATDSEISLGHSWVCKDKILLHEMLSFPIGEPKTYNGSGIKIVATWSKS